MKQSKRGGGALKILGIESTCDETAAAVVEDGRVVLSSFVASQIDEHKLYGGVVPEIASRRHLESITALVDEALKTAGLNADGIDAVAVSYAPGLIGAVLVGLNFAKGFGYANEIPLIPVHHLRAHIAANYLTYNELVPPFLGLIVSGANTCIVKVKSYTEFEVLGDTKDDAAGEAFDKAARILGLGYPGGREIEKLARKGNASAVVLPRPKFKDAPLNFSFSGLKTAVLNKVEDLKNKNQTVNVEDFAASFEGAVCDILLNSLEAAFNRDPMRKLAICGGVCANSKIRNEVAELAKRRGVELYMPDLKLCGDNAAMVASQGFYEYTAGNIASLDLDGVPTKSVE